MIEQNYTVDSTLDGDLQVSYKNVLKADETQIHVMAYMGKADYDMFTSVIFLEH